MIYRLVLLSVIILSLVACGGTTPPTKVKIAVSFGLTLEDAEIAMSSIRLALTETHHMAGNVEVELVAFNPYDTAQGQPSTTMEAEFAHQVVADPNVVAYLGPNISDLAKVSLPILNQAGLTQVGATASWPGLTKVGFERGEPSIYYPVNQRHFFRVNVTDDVQGVVATTWTKQLGYHKIYLVNDGGVYGKGLTGIFEVAAKDAGLDIINESYDAKATSTDLETLAERIVAANPDMLYVAFFTDEREIRFLEKLRTLKPNLPIMGGDGLIGNILTDKGDKTLLEGIYATNINVPASQLETAKPFIESYKKVYGKEPEDWVLPFYESTKVVLKAIATAKEPTRKGVLDSMKHLGDYTGTFGTWHFDENGDTSLKLVTGWQVKDGKWTFIQLIK